MEIKFSRVSLVPCISCEACAPKQFPYIIYIMTKSRIIQIKK